MPLAGLLEGSQGSHTEVLRVAHGQGMPSCQKSHCLLKMRTFLGLSRRCFWRREAVGARSSQRVASEQTGTRVEEVGVAGRCHVRVARPHALL